MLRGVFRGVSGRGGSLPWGICRGGSLPVEGGGVSAAGGAGGVCGEGVCQTGSPLNFMESENVAKCGDSSII